MSSNRREFLALAGTTVVSGCSNPLPNTTAEYRYVQDARIDGGLRGPWPTYGRDFQNTRHREFEPSLVDDAEGTRVRPAQAESGLPPILGPNAGYGTVGNEDSGSVVSYEFDGAKRWKNDEVEAYSPPTVYGRTLFVSRESETAALDTETGDVYWRRSIGTSSHDTSPLVADGTVFVPKSSLLAFDAETGKVEWRSDKLPELAQGTALDDEVLYVTVGSNGSGGIAALDRSTGEFDWKTTAVGETYYPPVVGDGAVYVLDTESRLHRLAAAEGTVQWTTQFSQRNQEPGLALANGTLFVTEGSGVVHAVDATDGTTLWINDRGLSGPPLVCGNTVYVYEDAAESANAIIIALNAETGEQIARYPTAGEPTSPLAATDDRIYYVGKAHEGTGSSRAVFAVGDE